MEKKWEMPKCNYCFKNDTVVLWKNVKTWEYDQVFKIVKCVNCNLVFLSPRPSRLIIGNYYPAESYWGDDVNLHEANKNAKKLRTRSYRNLYKIILSKSKSGSIFDIGAGTGLFLSYFKEKNWEVSGVEFSDQAVEYANKLYNVNLKSGDFLDNKVKNKYDFVTMNNSLEHLYDPQRTLVEVRKILKKSGGLLITVPNINSIGSQIFGPNWYALSPPRHLYHFSNSTLKNMLKRAGFKIIEEKHNYFLHNYYTILESFRIIYSPKFKTAASIKKLKERKFKKEKFSLKKEAGKLIFKLLSFILAILGQVLRRGEVVIIYAKK